MMTSEELQHWRCPECGRLYSDAEPFVDQVWCLGDSSRFIYHQAHEGSKTKHWVKMKRFYPDGKK